MAFYPNQQDEGRVSEFNAAALKMRRLDKIQDILNDINSNLLAYNEEYGVYNFQLKFDICNSLYQEVDSKLTDVEKTDTKMLREAIATALEKYPIYETRINKIDNKTKIKFNKGVWNVMKNWLFEYESKIRKLIDDHGMDTMYNEDEGLF